MSDSRIHDMIKMWRGGGNEGGFTFHPYTAKPLQKRNRLERVIVAESEGSYRMKFGGNNHRCFLFSY